jgi:hypothetical protein
MKVTRILAALALLSCIAGAAQAQNGCARLSWVSCATWVENQNYAGPNSYKLNLSYFGVGAPNVGVENQIRIRHLEKVGNTISSAVPDAWHFEDTPPGCQNVLGAGASQDNLATGTGCAAFRGPSPLLAPNFQIDLDGSAIISLNETYNNFSPVATTRYSVLNVAFDHSFSVTGPTTPGGCGGVELCENFSIDFAMLDALSGFQLPLTNCDQDPTRADGTVATWNGGCEQPVAATPTTWGKLKGMYH